MVHVSSTDWPPQVTDPVLFFFIWLETFIFFWRSFRKFVHLPFALSWLLCWHFFENKSVTRLGTSNLQTTLVAKSCGISRISRGCCYGKTNADSLISLWATQILPGVSKRGGSIRWLWLDLFDLREDRRERPGRYRIRIPLIFLLLRDSCRRYVEKDFPACFRGIRASSDPSALHAPAACRFSPCTPMNWLGESVYRNLAQCHYQTKANVSQKPWWISVDLRSHMHAEHLKLAFGLRPKKLQLNNTTKLVHARATQHEKFSRTKYAKFTRLLHHSFPYCWPLKNSLKGTIIWPDFSSRKRSGSHFWSGYPISQGPVSCLLTVAALKPCPQQERSSRWSPAGVLLETNVGTETVFRQDHWNHINKTLE